MKRCGLYLLGFIVVVVFAVAVKWSEMHKTAPAFEQTTSDPVNGLEGSGKVSDTTLLEVTGVYPEQKRER
jgi:hypothetical protein